LSYYFVHAVAACVRHSTHASHHDFIHYSFVIYSLIVSLQSCGWHLATTWCRPLLFIYYYFFIISLCIRYHSVSAAARMREVSYCMMLTIIICYLLIC